MNAATATDPASTPGALQDAKRRELADGGVIEFEFAPAGWLTQTGEPRYKDWRAYFFTPPDRECSPCRGTGRVAGKTAKGRKCALCSGSGSAAKRARLTATSSVLSAICPKDGLPFWAEARGIEGCLAAVRLGELDPEVNTGEDAVQRVRALRLGADRARDEAAERGLNTHAVLEEYMTTGKAPDPSQHPAEHWGYLRGLTRFLLDVDPEPVAVEELVASPADGYAGRLDLRARVGDRLITFDAKTQEKGAIYDAAHLQVGLYERAAVVCGDEPADELRVVVFAANGEYRQMPCAAGPAALDAALAYWKAVRPVTSACDAANRRERDTRR